MKHLLILELSLLSRIIHNSILRSSLQNTFIRTTTIKNESMKIIGTLFILLFAVATGCKPTTNQSDSIHQTFNKNPDLAQMDIGKTQIESIDSLMQSFVDQEKLNCVTGFVAKGGNVIYNKAFGWKDVENKIPAMVDDYYVLFSQTKAVTSVAFMTLVEKGLVKVDDPVSAYFPEIPNHVVTKVHDDGSYEIRPVASPMTFAHLLAHSSGLNAGLVRQIRYATRRNSDTPAGFGGRIPDKIPAGQRSGGGNFNSKYLEEEMLDLAKYPLGFDPGTEWNYHVSSNMLAYMVERISGKPLREYVKENVLIPLGMHDTDWYYEPEKLSRFVKAYSVTDGKLVPATNMYSESTISSEQTYCEGAIGLNGPIEDYARFCQMLLNKGVFNGHRILKPETIELMTTINQLPEMNSGGNGFQFGLGFELYNELKKPVPSVSNTAYAWGGMYGTQYIVDPENELIALFYINMARHESPYPQFLSKVYEMIKD
jgi:CubicO group peptidase (beta-lactamase class C family)